MVAGSVLDLAGHRGVVHYDPTELAITVRAGTRLSDIDALLRSHGQMLSFEPPSFGAATTIGGVVAAGLAGPRRPFTGAVRDSVLGVKILDGRARVLRFGGVVFKNVAGFDAFRLMAGALGCLGVLLEISLRVAPLPRVERAVALELDFGRARERMSELVGQPLPLSGLCCDGERMHVRLSGGEAAVVTAAAMLGGEGERLEFWTELRDLRHRWFVTDRLWRLALPMTAPALQVQGRWFWDWGGAQRWLISGESPDAIRNAAHAAGGHATLWRGAGADEEVFSPLAAPVAALNARLKAAFDPQRILNPGRMYAAL